MKTKTQYTYYVITQESNGKFISGAVKVGTSNNLLSYFRQWKHLTNVTAFKTFTEAKRTAEAWNEMYLYNGTHMWKKNPTDESPDPYYDNIPF